jgi:hypothetical protein
VHVVLGFDLDPSTGVDGPLDRSKLRCELVVTGIDVDLPVLEQFPKRPVVLGPATSTDHHLRLGQPKNARYESIAGFS